MRILGLDYGDKNIGVALSDPFGWTAQSLETIQKSHSTEYKKSLARLQEIVTQYQVDTIVLGYPKHLNNTEGIRCKKTTEFQKKLMKRFPHVKIVLWDERLSTVAANRSLMEGNVKPKTRKTVIDKMAAVYILQGYLDSNTGKE